MMRFLLILFLVSCSASAETGYVYEDDFNADGISDSLRSGPIGMFGNGGGPFMLSLSNLDGSFSKKVIGLHPRAAAIEKNGQHSRVWGYWHLSADHGRMQYTLLDGTFEDQNINLYFNDERNGLSQALYDLVFDKNKIIKFKVIKDYVPPEYPWGK